MTAIDEPGTKLPFYMKGNYAPVQEEIEAVDLPVVGELPPELNGRFFRNGANPPDGVTPSHWFDGDGMLHGIRLRDGNADWYRNRWVRTKLLAGEQRFDPETFDFDLSAGRANTHVLRHAGRIFALEEGSFPNEVSPDLDTLGPTDFGGAVTTPVTAHPHVCAETPIETPTPVMMHDFAISRNHAIFMDLPVVFDLDIALGGAGMPFCWRPDNGSRIGLVDRRKIGTGVPVKTRWFDIDSCYVFHIVNAWEEDDGNVVVLDAGRHQSMWDGSPDAFEPCYLWRWRFDLRTGAVTEEQLDDMEHAFPRIDDRRTGLANRFSWAVTGRPDEPAITDAATGVVKYDLTSGSSTFHDFGAGRSTSEPVFVPADDGAGEDDGWVLSFVYDKADQTSQFVVLDAADMAAKPVATIALPQRVPHGFHGSWIADEN